MLPVRVGYRLDGLPHWFAGLLIAFCLAPEAGAAAPLPGTPFASADTTLLAALHAAVLRSNPELVARRALVATARAKTAAAGFGPAVAAAAEVEEVPNGINAVRAGSIRLTLEKTFLGARLVADRAVAATEVDAALAALDASVWRVLALADRAATRIILWSTIADRLAAEDSLLTSAEVSLRARFAVAEARYADVLRLRAERLRVQSEQTVARTEALVASRALDALWTPTDSLAAAARAAVASAAARGAVPALAGAPPPDIDSLLVLSSVARRSEAALARARAMRALVLARQRPLVTAFAGAQRFLGEAGRFAVGGVAGASVSLPFTARKASARAASAADSEIVATAAFRDAALAGLRGELLAIRDRYEAARARLAIFEVTLLRGAREERESALASYRAGGLSLIELLDFERALSRAETDRLRAEIDAADAFAALITGTFGGPLEPPALSTPTGGDR